MYINIFVTNLYNQILENIFLIKKNKVLKMSQKKK